jgi:hypothetical protein
MIFVLLCLTTFATLAMISALTDYRLAQRVVSTSDNYFAADSAAVEKLAEISDIVSTADSAQQMAEELQGLNVSFSIENAAGDGNVSYVVYIDEISSLNVILEIRDRELSITSWRVEVSYDPDAFGAGGLPVWTGD